MATKISRFGSCIFGIVIIPILAMIVLAVLIFEKSETYKNMLLAEDRENE